jgi:hypothetical protein
MRSMTLTRIGAIAAAMMLTGCGAAHHSAPGVHPAAQTPPELSSKQLCLTIFHDIAGTKLPPSLHAKFTLMLKEAKQIQNLAGQAGSPGIARDVTNLAKAYSNDARAFYNNVSTLPDAIALTKASQTVINALGCLKIRS